MAKRLFFTFVFDYPNPFDFTTRWMPNMGLFSKYPHLEGIVKMECDVVGDSATKEFAPGKKWGYRLGYIEADEAALLSFGTSLDDILTKGSSVLSQYEIKVLSDDELSAYFAKWTTLTYEEITKIVDERTSA